MKLLGYALITSAFVFGSFLTVQHPEEVDRNAFLATLAVGAIGIALARYATKSAATSETQLSAGLEAVGSSLGRLVEKSAEFVTTKESIDTYDLRHHIDDHFRDDIETFVEARESIAHTYGLQAYANVMSHFAAAERYINRVWSASTDGYIDEAHAYVDKAAEQFREASQGFERLRQASN